MRIIQSILLLACCLCINRLAGADTIHLVTGNYPPYEYEEAGKVQGISVDILTEAFRRSNISVEFKVMPWARALQEAVHGDSDGVFSTIKTMERERILDYSREAIVPLVVSLFVKKDAPIHYQGDLAALSDFRFGLINQFSNGRNFDDAVHSGMLKNIVIVDNTDTDIKMLLAGRIDILVNNRYDTIFFLKKQHALDKVVELTPTTDDSYSYLAFTKKRDLSRMRNAFDSGLAAMKKDGSYQRILDRYSQ